jgi:hypothetical protein
MRTLLVPGDRQEILERIETLRPDSRREWGRMSPHEAVCHLGDSFAVALGEMTASPATGWLRRTVVKWSALYLPIPWPKGIPTRPELDQAVGGGSRPVDFERDRARLRQLMERFALAGAWKPHPLFGAMGAGEWMRWGYLHTDHHLRQFGC